MNHEPTEHGIDVAAAALAKASLFDVTIRHGDPMVIAAWAQILDDLEIDEAIAAVDRHYAQANPPRLVPGTILSLARAKRQDDHLRGVVRRREIDAPRDPETSHRAYLEARRQLDSALAAAEVVADAPDLSAACSWCGSKVGQPCTTNGNPRSTNHPSRPVSVTA